jgi:hypothetical protein
VQGRRRTYRTDSDGSAPGSLSAWYHTRDCRSSLHTRVVLERPRQERISKGNKAHGRIGYRRLETAVDITDSSVEQSLEVEGSRTEAIAQTPVWSAPRQREARQGRAAPRNGFGQIGCAQGTDAAKPGDRSWRKSCAVGRIVERAPRGARRARRYPRSGSREWTRCRSLQWSSLAVSCTGVQNGFGRFENTQSIEERFETQRASVGKRISHSCFGTMCLVQVTSSEAGHR